VTTTNKNFKVRHGLTVAAEGITFSDGSTQTTAASGGGGETLTIGTGLSGTSYNGSTAVTIAVDSTVTTNSGTQTLTNKTLTSPKINEDVAVTATATELNYVDGVTSAIQTQLDGKVDESEYSAKGKILVGTGTGTFTALTVGATNGHVLTVDSAEASGVKWAAGGGGGGGGGFTISDTAPSSPTEGSAWFDSTTGYTYIYYNDGNSSQWVQLLGTPGPQGPAGPAGATGATGPSSLAPDDDQFVLSSRIFA
jgi:hypothetical protein